MLPPEGLKPFRHCLKTGDPMPLFVPAELLESTKRRNPGLWIEVQPAVLPPLGRPIVWEDFIPRQPGAS